MLHLMGIAMRYWGPFRGLCRGYYVYDVTKAPLAWLLTTQDQLDYGSETRLSQGPLINNLRDTALFVISVVSNYLRPDFSLHSQAVEFCLVLMEALALRLSSSAAGRYRIPPNPRHLSDRVSLYSIARP